MREYPLLDDLNPNEDFLYRDVPKNGEIRTISRFLIFPREIGNKFRWLQFVRIKQVAVHDWTDWQWEDLDFID